MLQVPVKFSCCQSRFLDCCIVKIVNTYSLTDIDREERFFRRYVIPTALFIEQMLATVDDNHPQIAVAAHGNIGRAALQLDGFSHLRARAFRENQ